MEVLMNEASNIPQISGHAGDPQSKTDNYNPDNCNQELCLRKAVKEHEAADISFEDLRYKVSIGFRRGNFLFRHIVIITVISLRQCRHRSLIPIVFYFFL